MRIRNNERSMSIRTVSALLLVFAVVCVSSTLFVNESEGDRGDKFWIEGIQYEQIDDSRASVIGHVDGGSTPHDRNLTIGSTVEYGGESLSVVSIGDSAFMGCTALTSISIDSVKEIGGSAFMGCASLSSVSMKSVEKIGKLAFDDCTDLKSISLPDSVSITNNIAFYHCPIDTVTITGHGYGGASVLYTFFKNDPWKIDAEQNEEVTTLIIDTSDGIDISNVNIIEGNILKITSSSKSVTGPEGKMFSGSRMLSKNEISGKEFTGTDDGTGTIVWKTHETSIDTCILSLHADDPNYGEAIGSGIYEYDSFVQISAIPKEGYRFVEWSDGNTDEKRTLKLTSNRSLTAYFAEEDPTMCKVTVIIEGNGMVYGMGTVEKGKVITLNAVADDGYSFQGWSHTTYTGTTISLSVESNMVITATFSTTDTGIGGASNSLIDTTTAIVIILIIVIVFGSIVVISLVRGRRSV